MPAQDLDRAADAFLAGRLQDAAAICGAVLRDAPDHPGAGRQLGLIRLVEGDPAGALALLRPLRGHFVDDGDLEIALAEAEWATGSAAAAIPHLRRVLALAPGRTLVRARLGLALLTDGQPDAARQELEQVLQVQPGHVVATTHLGAALLALGRGEDAVAVLQPAVALDPADPAPAFQLGQALRSLGRIEPAIEALRDAVRRGPGQAYLRVALGDALLARGEHAPARQELRAAVELDPASFLGWAKLGDLEQLADDPHAALECYRRAAALAPGDAGLRVLLGNALFACGDALGAARELGQGMQAAWAGAAPARRSDRLRVGILAAPGAANTPTDWIIDRATHAVQPIFMLDGLTYPRDHLAGACDVLFNAVSDPDAAPGPMALAARLAPEIGLPVLNPPDRIPGTVRHLMAARLAGIPGLRVPLTRRHRRAELLDPAAALRDFPGPVLVRPVGSHGGRDLEVAATSEAVQRIAAALPSEDAYLTEFRDFRSRDGLYRKLRLVFVAGEVFPVHLAIADDWLSHYFRTRMAQEQALRDEEAAFLRRPDCYLGRQAMAALDEVQARVGLDFFGLDGAIDRDGELVVFECNATMLVRHVDRPAMFDYKRGPAERVRDAVGALLRRAARP